MMDLIDFLLSDEAVLVYIIALIISVLYIIFYFIKKTSENRKLKHNTMELKKLSEEVLDLVDEKESVEVLNEKELVPVMMEVNKVVEKEVKTDILTEVVAKQEEVIDMTTNMLNSLDNSVVSEKEENITYTSIEPKKEDAIKELEEITEKLENQELNNNIELTEFEKMQEDTAIISLDELMAKAKTLYQENSDIKYQDDGNEPITIEEFESRRNKETISIPNAIEENKSLTLDELYNVKIESVSNNGYRTNDIISPIYGINKENNISHNELELENTANYEKLDEEIRKTNQFIETLKELQKELD